MESATSPAISQLCAYLRGLTQRLDPGAGWYGEFLRRDPEGMRACLDGAAMPPWDVVESLLRDLAVARGAEFAARESAHAARLRAAAVTVWDRLPGGEAELRTLLAASASQRAESEAALRSLTARLGTTTDRAGADALARELSWTQDDAARAAARYEDLAARLTTLQADALGPAPSPQPPPAAPRAAHPTPSVPPPTGRTNPDPPPAPLAGRGKAGAAPEVRAERAGARAVPETWAGRGGTQAVPEPWAGRGGAGVTPEPWAGSAEAPAGPEERPERAGAEVPEPWAGRGGAGVTPEPWAGSAEARAVPEGRPERAGAEVPEPWAGRADVRAVHDGESGWGGGSGPAVAAEGPVGRAEGRWLRGGRRAGGARYAGSAAPAAPAFTAPPGHPGGTGPEPGPGGLPAPRGARFGTPQDPAPRGARFGRREGRASESAAPGAPGSRPEPVSADALVEPPAGAGERPGYPRAGEERRAEALAAELLALRAQGRSGEAHALLCEAAAWPAGRLPALAAELARAGLAADWDTLLWEAASLPPGHLAATAAALGDAGRRADCDRLLRQGAARPAAEVAAAALALDGAGRTREAEALLGAFVRVRTAEEAAGLARRDPQWFAPRLLGAARALAGSHHRDLAHALRVAGLGGVW
ncbi:hypothetical protein [Streptomyces sp. NPDC054797]